MNENMHVSKQFDADLSGLRGHVLEMGGLVESQISAAIEAYASGETEIVTEIVERDHRVNAFEKIIDDETVQVIARRQPTASDLRLVMGITKIVTDLERVGDEAKKIAKGARRIHEYGQSVVPRATDVRHVAGEAVMMLRKALDCFARMDVTGSIEVIHADAKVDSEFKSLVRQLITFMMEDPRTISTALDIIWICRSIERIGDHAKNIAEHVIYIAEGRDIRHSGKEKGK